MPLKTMAFFYLLTLFLVAFLPSSSSTHHHHHHQSPPLSLDYYDKTCPSFNDIMTKVTVDKQMSHPSTAAAAVRLFFHDCVVQGCDASILVASNAFNKAERDDDLNRALPGDGFDVVTRAKTHLELTCPGVVSCADILAVAARNLVTIVGGPHYHVLLGRKDGLESKVKDVEGHIAPPNMSLTEIIKQFEKVNLSIQEMVVLTGSHTIGFSHCDQFSYRLYNYSKTSKVDPTLNPKYAERLQKLCANHTKNPALSAYNDPMSPGKFDNMYFVNLRKGLALLESDQHIATDPRTKPFVDLYAKNKTLFFHDYAKTMEKVSLLNVKTGNEGEVRHRCDTFNSLSMNNQDQALGFASQSN